MDNWILENQLTASAGLSIDGKLCLKGEVEEMPPPFLSSLDVSLLALQSGAHRRGAFRDFHPIPIGH